MGVVLLPNKYYIDWTTKRSGYIDIWWLYDDGGLTVLIPHLLKSHHLFKHCTLRIMALENMGMHDQIKLASLMKKLRIDAEIFPIKSRLRFQQNVKKENESKEKEKNKGKKKKKKKKK